MSMDDAGVAGPGSSPSVEPQAGLDASHSIPIAGGWCLVRDDDRTGGHYRDWFLCDPDGIWVAKFWDGPEAGATDARAFAAAVARGIDAGTAETQGGSVHESPKASLLGDAPKSSLEIKAQEGRA